MFVIASSREYYAKIRIGRDNLDKVRRSQLEMLNKGFYLRDSEALVNAIEVIGPTATVLGLAFVMNTPVGIAAGITGILACLGAGAISNVESLIQQGTIQLMNMVDFMTDNPQYDMVEFDIPWLSYVSTANETIRFCEATSTAGWAVTAVHTPGGWQLTT